MLKKFKSKKFIALALVILAIGGFIIYNSSKKPMLLGTKATVVEDVVRETVSASGVVLSANEAMLSFSSIGQLNRFPIKKGEVVKQGQLLASLSNYDSSQTTQSYKDLRDLAKRDLELYIENYVNDKNDVGGTDEYNLNIKRLEELLSKAEASYQASIGSLAKTYIYAPFAGTIVDIYKESGEVVGVGQDVIKLADLNNLIFEMDIDQEDFGSLKLGQKVEVELDSYLDRKLEGEVIELPKYADSSTEQFTIRIRVTQSQETPVLLGMKGEARVIINTTEDKVKALTFDTIYKDDEDKPFVWINDNGLLKKFPIEIGLEGDIYTQLKTDLSDKNIVVPSANVEFIEGYQIKVEE